MTKQWDTVVGLDLSLASTGVAVCRERDLEPLAGLETHRVRSKPAGDDYGARLDRLEDLVARIVECISPAGANLILVEGPSYSSTGAGTFDRSGFWWMVYAALSSVDTRIVVVPPAQRMMYATGSGGGVKASKDAVLAAAIKRYPFFDITGNDVADAVILLALGMRGIDCAIDSDMPKTHMRAFDKIVFPS